MSIESFPVICDDGVLEAVKNVMGQFDAGLFESEGWRLVNPIVNGLTRAQREHCLKGVDTDASSWLGADEYSQLTEGLQEVVRGIGAVDSASVAIPAPNHRSWRPAPPPDSDDRFTPDRSRQQPPKYLSRCT